MPRGHARGGAAHQGGRDDGQRDEGARSGHAAPAVGSDRGGSRRRSPGRRAVGTELCDRGCAGAADRRCRGLVAMPARSRSFRANFAGRTSGSTAATMWLASRSAERSRTSLRSPPASSKVSGSVTTRWRRSSRAGSPRSTRLACAAGGRRETLAGLSGLGDLVLTCTGDLSRNRHVGIELARGRQLDEILAGMKMIAEGVRTTGAALALGARLRRRAADCHADGRGAGRARRRPVRARRADDQTATGGGGSA